MNIARKWVNVTDHLTVNELQNEKEENRKIINNKYKAVQGKKEMKNKKQKNQNWRNKYKKGKNATLAT